jgi:hypothetical protein
VLHHDRQTGLDEVAPRVLAMTTSETVVLRHKDPDRTGCCLGHGQRESEKVLKLRRDTPWQCQPDGHPF